MKRVCCFSPAPWRGLPYHAASDVDVNAVFARLHANASGTLAATAARRRVCLKPHPRRTGRRLRSQLSERDAANCARHALQSLHDQASTGTVCEFITRKSAILMHDCKKAARRKMYKHHAY